MADLKHLGKTSREPVDEVDLIDWSGEAVVVRLDCAELTAVCPVTGQPDFGALAIEYVPEAHLAETKSVKLYLWRYRDRPAFNEVLVDTIASDLYRQIRPRWLRVVGTFNPRGGIRVTATAERGDTKHRPS